MDAASSTEGHQTALKKAQWELRNHRGVRGALANASKQQLIETIRRERHAIMAKSDIWTKHSAYSRRIETIDKLVLEAENTIAKAQEKSASLQHERGEMATTVADLARQISEKERVTQSAAPPSPVSSEVQTAALDFITQRILAQQDMAPEFRAALQKILAVDISPQPNQGANLALRGFSPSTPPRSQQRARGATGSPVQDVDHWAAAASQLPRSGAGMPRGFSNVATPSATIYGAREEFNLSPTQNFRAQQPVESTPIGSYPQQQEPPQSSEYQQQMADALARADDNMDDFVDSASFEEALRDDDPASLIDSAEDFRAGIDADPPDAEHGDSASTGPAGKSAKPFRATVQKRIQKKA